METATSLFSVEVIVWQLSQQREHHKYYAILQ